MTVWSVQTRSLGGCLMMTTIRVTAFVYCAFLYPALGCSRELTTGCIQLPAPRLPYIAVSVSVDIEFPTTSRALQQSVTKHFQTNAENASPLALANQLPLPRL